ncbi:anti-sigma-W factor RsiW [Candidatus Velamenicoccus archaeovorus]|uniref:Anti-sigma-W factor RsiW n=1 Tax=Velamenicoccus archaeovorus TaxID=1930593 RepID=A0A410P2U5_VELA1|nr:zf-HC2 domain-containing protein [Candidatus Velamenicoccus archaeovorus]QAT16489.1 anti-sigma-W factor RsiW [Candidatus Velamenicoccus archaeovorus]
MGMCFFVKRKLLDFAEGDIPECQAVQVRAHLESCPACRGRLAEIRRGLQAAGLHRETQMSEDFWKKFDVELQKKIFERECERFPRTGRRFVWVASVWRPALIALPVLVIMFAVATHLRVFSPAAREEALVRDAAWLMDEASDEQGTLSSDDDITADIEILYLADPSAFRENG